MGSVSRVHTFASAAVLTAAQLNNEFDNLLTSSAINGGLDATNLGVTAGQITASKAVVVDGSRNLDDGTTSNQINNLVLSGTLSVAGATTQTGALSIDDTTNSTSTTTGSIHTDGGVGIALDLIVGNDVKLLTDSSVLSLGIGSDATLTHDGTTGLTIAANPVIVDSGDALTLDAHTGIVIFKDAGSEVLRFTEGNSGDVTIKLATNGKDLIFTDNGDATGLKVLDAAVGINVPGEVQTTKIAYTDGDDAITIADGGGVTTSGTLATTGAATLASLVCTAAGTFGGGYGDTGATISTLGVIQANGAITSDGAVTGATLAGTVSTAAQNSITSASSLATVGTITSGTWQGTKVASAYLDDQTAHLNVTQSFTGAKTFGAATQFNSTVTVGVNDTGYDVQLFGATDGSNILWDQSADDLIFTNAGIAVGSDATGDIYYRDANGFLARLAASTDGHVLTTGGAGTIPAFEALPSGGSFSGPGSSTDNAVVRFNGTGGATGQNSGLIVDDSNNVTGAANVTLSGELDAATGDFSGDVDVDGTLEADAITIGGTGIGSIYGVVAGSSSIVTTGALDSGSITSGFGTIDTGSSAITTTGVITGGTVEATTDTAAGDNAAMGYTAAEGLILAGQGSTSDVTIKNDADGTVMRIPTGTKNVGIGVGTLSPITGRLMTRGVYTALTSGIGDSTIFCSGGNSYSGKANTGGVLAFGGEYDSSSTITHWAGIAGLAENNTNGHYGGYMAFYTRANGAAAVERMRIDSNGKISQTKAADGDSFLLTANSDSAPYGFNVFFSGASPDDNGSYFFFGRDASAQRIFIYSDGDLQNHDNSYGGISDAKLKTDIVSARNYWDDFKQIQFRKFKFLSDVEQYGNDANSRFGVIAQEIETIFPSLIKECPDFEDREIDTGEVDENGDAIMVEERVDLGTTTKGVKYSILSQIGLKVVQELGTRLEAAEAKITALESA